MKINKSSLIVFLIASVIFSIVGAYFKLQHFSFAEIFIEIALVFVGVFIALCLIDVIRDKTLKTTEKWMYVLLVICFPLLGGIIYLLRPERKDLSSKFEEL